jgi:hypothetical protein
MYCILTKREINKTKEDVLKHYNGKTFSKKLCKYYIHNML